MKVNFNITDNHALNIAGRHIDLHNNFDFVGFDYNVADREIKLHWKKSSGDWVDKNEFSSLVLTHRLVTFLKVIDQDEKSNYDDDSCLGEITFFPSAEREINDSIVPQSEPNDGDDIIYFFENGQRIRIHCEKIELSMKLPLNTSDNNFTPFPILTTERLTLRQLSTDDQQPIFALRSDAEINKYLGRAPSKTIEDAINFINSVNDNIKNNNSIYWVISLTKTFVGTICLFNFSNEQNSCEIGYELMTKFQGQGIMKEAIEAVIDYAFQTLQFQKIVAFTHNENQGSTKLLAKLNFLSEETDKENPDFTIFTLTKPFQN